MPATAGRTRMPHNNRVSTAGALQTSSIWKQTIGHDPYADREADAERDAIKVKSAEQAKGLLELARHQNVANQMSSSSGGNKVAGGDDFARKMFHGLKPKKLGRDPGSKSDNATMGDRKRDAKDLMVSSSSEDEFIEVVKQEEDNTNNKLTELGDTKSQKRTASSSKKKKKSSKKKKRRYDNSSSDEDGRERHRKNKRRKHKSSEKKGEKKSRRSDSYSSSD